MRVTGSHIPLESRCGISGGNSSCTHATHTDIHKEDANLVVIWPPKSNGGSIVSTFLKITLWEGEKDRQGWGNQTCSVWWSLEGEIMGSEDERWDMCESRFLGSAVGQCHLFLTLLTRTVHRCQRQPVTDAPWPLLTAISAIRPNNFGNY